MQDGLLVGESPDRNVPLVVGPKQHIQPPHGAAPVVHPGGHVEPADPLAGLPEGRGRLRHEALVHLGQFRQVLTPVRVGLGHAPGLRHIRADPRLQPKHHMLEALVELIAVRVLCAVVADLPEQTSEAKLQPDGKILAEVLLRADARREAIQAVCGGEMRAVEVGVPAHLAVGAEVGAVPAQ